MSIEDFAHGKLEKLEEQGLKRTIITTTRLPEGKANRAGRELISFCCNDYLNFTRHPKVKQAAIEAIETYGAGSGASRLITGNHPLIHKLEQRLAKIKDTDDACVFSSGYMANMGIIPTFMGEGDIIFLDQYSHACLHAGSQLSQARRLLFHHNDMDHLKELMDRERQNYRHALIATDGVFSMDGDLAPLDQLSQLAQAHDCWLMSDDAHGLGVMGHGKGSRHEFDPLPPIDLQMGTLSKALGSFGGYLCASQPVIDLIKTRARSLIYTTALPPASAAAALAALDIIENEIDYCRQALENARIFTELLNLPDPQSPIVPIIIGDSDRTMEYAALLEQDGFLITGIRPPTVAEGTARLRFTFTARHTPENIHQLARSLKKNGIL